MTSRNTGKSPAMMAVARAVVKTPVLRAEAGSAKPTKPAKPAEPGARMAKLVAKGRPSTRSDLSRIAELKVKLRDEDYMNDAILRIATVLSAKLTLR